VLHVLLTFINAVRFRVITEVPRLKLFLDVATSVIGTNGSGRHVASFFRVTNPADEANTFVRTLPPVNQTILDYIPEHFTLTLPVGIQAACEMHVSPSPPLFSFVLNILLFEIHQSPSGGLYKS
jgi:hypothetical protein